MTKVAYEITYKVLIRLLTIIIRY